MRQRRHLLASVLVLVAAAPCLAQRAAYTPEQLSGG